MAEIIHHTEESASGDLSPFDTSIQEIVAGEDVLIACPYITLDYLEPVLREADSWRLLTDTEAWLDNYASDQREAIREFIARHHDRIHDVRNLHAKAVIGETGALVGSANLTRMGVGKRDELAVRFNESERIAELREWFDGLWNEGSPPKLDEIDERIRTSSPVASSARGGGATSISSDARRVSASIAESDTRGRNREVADTDDEDAYERLIGRLRRAPNRSWAAEHFELMREVIQITGLTEEDTQLVTSVPASGTEIRIIIGSRVVFGFIGKPGNWTRYIIPDEYPELYAVSEDVPYCFDFKGQKDAPHLPTVTDGLYRTRQTRFRKAWIEAIFNEVGRFTRSSYRSRSHEPIVYRAAVDHEYRERVLDEAFGT